MTDDSTKKWAEILTDKFPLVKPWSWDWKFNRSLEHHMHALGVISVNYNDLEHTLYMLFHYFLNDYQSKVPALLFPRLSNDRRLDYMREFCKSYHSGEQKGAIDRFLDGFDICAYNRNVLAHASIPDTLEIAEAADPSVVLHKRAQGNYSSVSRIENMTVTRLRQIADEIADYEIFGFKLYMFLLAQRVGGTLKNGEKTVRPTLPEILPLQVDST
jgi:hypothetical protein